MAESDSMSDRLPEAFFWNCSFCRADETCIAVGITYDLIDKEHLDCLMYDRHKCLEYVCSCGQRYSKDYCGKCGNDAEYKAAAHERQRAAEYSSMHPFIFKYAQFDGNAPFAECYSVKCRICGPKTFCSSSGPFFHICSRPALKL
jgi:hypothetical protein